MTIIQETGYDLRFSLDPRLSAEFGFNLGQERHSWVHSRLAIFADYGFNTNMWGSVPAGEGVSTIVGEPADYQSYQLTHFYLLPQTAGKILPHFQVGLKFTLVLGE